MLSCSSATLGLGALLSIAVLRYRSHTDGMWQLACFKGWEHIWSECLEWLYAYPLPCFSDALCHRCRYVSHPEFASLVLYSSSAACSSLSWEKTSCQHRRRKPVARAEARLLLFIIRSQDNIFCMFGVLRARWDSYFEKQRKEGRFSRCMTGLTPCIKAMDTDGKPLAKKNQERSDSRTETNTLIFN